MPLTYISNWPRNFRLFFRQFKWAYQRITRGYCDADTYDLDSYYLDLFHATINHLADTTHGYPGTEEFPTPEAWDKYLRDMAICFYRANESNDYYPHPAENEWWEEVSSFEEPWNHDSPKSKAMCDEAIQLIDKRVKDVENGMDMLKHVFFHLWD